MSMSEVNFSRRGSMTSLSTVGSGTKKDTSGSNIRSMSTESLFQMEERFSRNTSKKVPNGIPATPKRVTSPDGFHKSYGGTYYFPNGEIFRPRLTPTKRNRPLKIQSKSLPGSRNNSLTNQAYHYIPQSPSGSASSSRSSPGGVIFSLSSNSSPISRSSSFNNLKNKNKQDLAKNIRSHKQDTPTALNWEGITVGSNSTTAAKLQSNNILKNLSLLSLSDEVTKSSDSNDSSISNFNRSSSNTPTTSINTNEENGETSLEVKSNNSMAEENLSTLNEVSEETIARTFVSASPALSDDIFKTPVSSPCIPSSQSLREEVMSNRQSVYHDAESIYNDVEEIPSPSQSVRSPNYEAHIPSTCLPKADSNITAFEIPITKENGFGIGDTSQDVWNTNEDEPTEESNSEMPTPTIDVDEFDQTLIQSQNMQSQTLQDKVPGNDTIADSSKNQNTASSTEVFDIPEVKSTMTPEANSRQSLNISESTSGEAVTISEPSFSKADIPATGIKDRYENLNTDGESTNTKSNANSSVPQRNKESVFREISANDIESRKPESKRSRETRSKIKPMTSVIKPSDGPIDTAKETNSQSNESERTKETRNHKRAASSLSSYGSAIDNKFGLSESSNSDDAKPLSLWDNISTNASSNFTITSETTTLNSSPSKSLNKNQRSSKQARLNNGMGSTSKKPEKKMKNSTSISNLRSMCRNLFSHSKAKENEDSSILLETTSRSDTKSINSVSSISRFKRTFSLNNLTVPISSVHNGKRKQDEFNRLSTSFSNSQIIEEEEPIVEENVLEELKLTKLPSIEKDDNLFDDMFNEVDKKLTEEEEVIERQKNADNKMILPFLQDDELTKDQIIDQQLKDRVAEMEYDIAETLGGVDDMYIDDNIRYLQKELTWFNPEGEELKFKSNSKDRDSNPKSSTRQNSEGEKYVVDNNHLSDIFSNINEYQKRSLPDHFKYIEQFKDFNELEIRVRKFEDILPEKPGTKKFIPTPPILKKEHSENPNKKVFFSNKILINETFSPDMYKRYNKSVTQYTLTEASQIIRIKDELNQYKCKEMLVHELSQQNTQFFY